SDYPYWTGPDFPFPLEEKIIDKLSDQQTLYPADKYFQYSNLGLSLAGKIVSEVSGESFIDYIIKNILDPLELKNTRPVMPKNLYGRELAIGHEARNRSGKRPPVPLFNAEGIGPAAGFSSTVIDLGKFAAWQFRVLDGENEVLNSNTLREMQRVHFLDEDWSPAWGLGFFIWRSNEIKFVGHGGNCPGYRSQLLIQPDRKIATVFMANASGINSRMYAQTAYEIFESAIDEAVSGKKVKTLDKKFKKYLGHYSEAPWSGEAVVITWESELAILYLPTEDPLDLTKLKHISGNTFKRIRNSDDPENLQKLGEEVVFELDKSGQVVSLWQHSNYSKKIK
ncbi:MAG: serine hydrolase domain-containing protein, partial [Candidatus Neomarinimicrobiota bacterium]